MSTSGTITGSFQFTQPVPTPPPILPPPPPNQCFLCVRKGMQYVLAVTVYNGTNLCAACAQALPNSLIVNEFPPTL